MKIKMTKSVTGAYTLRNGQEYDLPNDVAQRMIDATYAVRVQGIERPETKGGAANRETATIKKSN